jgi:hypothetical protein
MQERDATFRIFWADFEKIGENRNPEKRWINRRFLLTPKSQFFISPLIPHQFDRQLPSAPQLSITLSSAEPQ